MILYLLLIVVFGLIVLFFVGIIGCIFSAMTYTKKAFEYVRSKEFQNNAQKGAELIGKTVGSTTSGILSGLSKTLDDKAITNLASKSASILGQVTKTVASTLDSTIGNKNIYLDNTFENSGIELGRADEKYNTKTNDLKNIY